MKNKNKEVCYVVYVVSGQPYETTWSLQFVTKNELLAKKWVDKYNNIINNNKERAKEIMEDDNYELTESHWLDFIYYEDPVAEYQIEEFR